MNNLAKIRDLIKSGKKENMDKAFEITQALANQVDRELYNSAIVLQSEYNEFKRKELLNVFTEDEKIKANNNIKISLIKIVSFLDKNIEAKTLEAEDARKKGDLLGAIAYIDEALLLDENEHLREYKLEIESEILAKKTEPIEEEKKFYFGASFVIICCILSVPVLYFSKNVLTDGNRVLQSFLIGNFIAQISIIYFMVAYAIVPNVNIDAFIKTEDKYIRKKFNNRVDLLKVFATRANENIKQFGFWWKLLGFSFLALYFVYYLDWLRPAPDKIPSRYSDILDVIANTSEGFFLLILYRILTEETVKPIKDTVIKFQQNLNFQRETAFFLSCLALFLAGVFLNDETNSNYGLLVFISRTVSGAIVAVGLCLVIGRFDSKFIQPKIWEVGFLYLYGALQLLFTLFDSKLFEFAQQQAVNSLNSTDYNKIMQYFKVNNLIISYKSFVEVVKVVVLYIMLFLKAYFIYFVINIYREGKLFKYFLLGSKLIDDENKYSK